MSEELHFLVLCLVPDCLDVFVMVNLEISSGRRQSLFRNDMGKLKKEKGLTGRLRFLSAFGVKWTGLQSATYCLLFFSSFAWLWKRNFLESFDTLYWSFINTSVLESNFFNRLLHILIFLWEICKASARTLCSLKLTQRYQICIALRCGSVSEEETTAETDVSRQSIQWYPTRNKHHLCQNHEGYEHPLKPRYSTSTSTLQNVLEKTKQTTLSVSTAFHH